MTRQHGIPFRDIPGLLSRINLGRPIKYYKGAGNCLKGPQGIEGKRPILGS
ncbi:MAG TPA: hypothetical protein VEG28_00510 [Dehalococcoidia bacterium]|nr:hypothetical protein [Dehalococcoidia bacterium]